MLKLILFSTKVQHTCTNLGIDSPHSEFYIIPDIFQLIESLEFVTIYHHAIIIMMDAILNEK